MRRSLALVLVLVATPLAAAPMPKPSELAAAAPDAKICKRETPVGSLIASRKVCLTAKEWQERARNGNEIARNLVDEAAGACGQQGGVC